MDNGDQLLMADSFVPDASDTGSLMPSMSGEAFERSRQE
jgi:hypothetical protein